MESLLTTEEVADFLRVDVVTVRRLINKGGLSAYRVGSEFRFARADLEEFLRRQRTSGGENSIESRRFEKLTKRAEKTMHLASEEAHHLNHNYIGTEHILLGLLREGEGVAAQVLQSLGITHDAVRQHVIVLIGRGDSIILGEIGLTPRAKRTLELARDEARRLNHHFVGTEHLLLGLLRESEGIACSVLADLGVDLAQAGTKTVSILSSKTGAPPAAEMMTPPPVPAEASTLVPDGTAAVTCATCGAPNLPYFRYCFNCGTRLG